MGRDPKARRRHQELARPGQLLGVSELNPFDVPIQRSFSGARMKKKNKEKQDSDV